MLETFRLLRLGWENHLYRRQLAKLEEEQLGEFGWFRSLKRALKSTYRWKNPYRLARRAQRRLKLPQSDLIFGETPLSTALRLLQEAGVDHADHVVECGGGTSTFSLVAVSALGCRATVFEVVPDFVKCTRALGANLGLQRLKVVQGNMLTETLPDASLYFVSATTLTKESWQALQRQLAVASVGAQAISLSQPLDSKAWQVTQSWSMPFSWGENTVYLHRRI